MMAQTHTSSLEINWEQLANTGCNAGLQAEGAKVSSLDFYKAKKNSCDNSVT